ncbi:MAG TPA: helix-hairpin-helix domain-containing protein [Anaeromyxobacter sp.]|nr:helix-hairpin-helix domain-containing protein [Anaeromyxobacter sp.]
MSASIRSSRTRDLARVVVALACAAALATSAAAGPPAQPQPGQPAAPAAASPAAAIDINKASRAQLMTLPGIGDAEARKIVAGRPWLTKVDLVTRGVIPEGTYVAIKNRIVATQSGKPPRRK